MSNAVKYNHDNGSVILSCEQGSINRIRVTVSDTGHGIKEEQKEQIFEPFNRLEAGSTDIEGTGIGLTITKHLLESMDGSISLESQPGNGSRFTFELPVGEKAQQPVTVETDQKIAVPQPVYEQQHMISLCGRQSGQFKPG